MKREKLHTTILEKLYGSLRLEIVKQNEEIRVIQLLDDAQVTRTVGIVRFLNVKGESFKKVHDKIIDGAMLGKTLMNSKVNFTKDYKSFFDIELPQWIKNGFQTKNNKGFAKLSEIVVSDCSGEKNEFIYCELIEIVQNEIRDVFYQNKNKKKLQVSRVNVLLKKANLGFLTVNQSN